LIIAGIGVIGNAIAPPLKSHLKDSPTA